MENELQKIELLNQRLSVKKLNLLPMLPDCIDKRVLVNSIELVSIELYTNNDKNTYMLTCVIDSTETKVFDFAKLDILNKTVIQNFIHKTIKFETLQPLCKCGEDENYKEYFRGGRPCDNCPLED